MDLAFPRQSFIWILLKISPPTLCEHWNVLILCFFISYYSRSLKISGSDVWRAGIGQWDPESSLEMGGRGKPSELCFSGGNPQRVLGRRKGKNRCCSTTMAFEKTLQHSMLEQEEPSAWGPEGQREGPGPQLPGQIGIRGTRYSRWPCSGLPAFPQAVSTGGIKLYASLCSCIKLNVGIGVLAKDSLNSIFKEKIIWWKWGWKDQCVKCNFIEVQVRGGDGLWRGSWEQETFILDSLWHLYQSPDILQMTLSFLGNRLVCSCSVLE